MKMTMRIFKFIAYCIFTCSIYGQNDTSDARLNYTTGFKSRIETSNRLTNIEMVNALLSDTSSIWMRTRMQLSGLLTERDPIKNNFQTSILNPLRQQFSESQNMKEFKYFLGMVEVGAFGYLAYEHLRKYGFLKRK